MSVRFFSSLPNGQYSHLMIVVAFPPVKNSYLPTFPEG